MSQQVPKKDNTSTLVIVILVVIAIPILVAFCGICTAIAVPAFFRYVKASKTSEAHATTKQIALGVKRYYVENCEYPPEIGQHVDPYSCCGGEKCVPVEEDRGKFAVVGVDLSQPTYFAYETKLDGDEYRVIAKADMSCGGPMHTVEVTVTGEGSAGSCDAEISPALTENEFE